MASRTRDVAQMHFLWYGRDILLDGSFLQSWEGIAKSVQHEIYNHNYHTKLAIGTLGCYPGHICTGDQTSGIKSSFDTQGVGNVSSEQAIRAIGY